tara:strand:+ start:6536 stop:6991 length:456 start_codon:yes stop_codon:yes gene_type:complete
MNFKTQSSGSISQGALLDLSQFKKICEDLPISVEVRDASMGAIYTGEGSQFNGASTKKCIDRYDVYSSTSLIPMSFPERSNVRLKNQYCWDTNLVVSTRLLVLWNSDKSKVIVSTDSLFAEVANSLNSGDMLDPEQFNGVKLIDDLLIGHD